MRTKRLVQIAALGGLGGLLAISPALAQESGAEVWARACGRCHRAQPPTKYHADFWKAIMGHMALNARLTQEEEEAVTEWLMSSARRLSMEDTKEPAQPALLASSDPGFIPLVESDSGAELFGQQCAPCHGKSGKGDGPAAPALTPRPADLTNPDVLAGKTDDQLLEIIAKGKGAMPGFDALLTPEELQLVLEYVRGLSAEKD